MSLSGPNGQGGTGELSGGPGTGQPSPGVQTPAPGGEVTIESLQQQLRSTQEQLAGAQGLVGKHTEELGRLRAIESTVLEEPQLYEQVVNRLAGRNVPVSSGAQAPADQQPSPSRTPLPLDPDLSNRIGRWIQGVNNMQDPVQLKQEMESMLAIVRDQGAEAGARKALQEIAPHLERESAKDIRAKWEQVANDVRAKTGKDILNDANEKARLQRANTDLVLAYGFPAGTVLPPETLAAYVYKDEYVAAGQRQGQAAAQEASRQQGAQRAGQTIVPSTLQPGPGAAKLRTPSDYYRAAERHFGVR